ncbi:MAG TPA: hypothetical protein VNV66_22345 [Pilimelia sp.]|nr:hypothetical protein [Pilimelia sp.]
MADLAVVVATMRHPVEYPHARWAVLEALAALSDHAYQQRVWLRRGIPQQDFCDSLDLAIHTLYDDWAVLPAPAGAIGGIVVDGVGVERLIALDDVLSPLLEDLGDVPDSVYLKHPSWSQIRAAAAAALSAMVLEGPIPLP